MGDVGVHGSDIHCEEIGRGKVGAVVEGVDYLEGVGSVFYVGWEEGNNGLEDGIKELGDVLSWARTSRYNRSSRG